MPTTVPPLSDILHEPRFRKRWRALLMLLAAISAWFAFKPGGGPPAFDDADKLDHLLAFGSMGCAAALSLAAAWPQTVLAAAALVLYGGFIEVVQSFLPTRTADWADLAADAVGVVAGLVLAALLRRFFKR